MSPRRKRPSDPGRQPRLRNGDTVVFVGRVGESPRDESIAMGDAGVVVSVTNTPPEDYAYVRFPDTGVGGVPVESLRVVQPGERVS